MVLLGYGYLNTCKHVVCMRGVGNYFTKGSMYYYKDSRLTSNELGDYIYIGNLPSRNFRLAYKNEIKGTKWMIMNIG